jgi:ankyrin repeat protein
MGVFASQPQPATTGAVSPPEALVHAAAFGHVAQIRRLVDAGVDPNESEGTDQRTPLQWAARNGHAAAIAVLLAVGSRVDGLDDQGGTALTAAAEKGHEQAVDALLAAGADVNRATTRGHTPLHLATYWGHARATASLLLAGARMDVEDNDGRLPTEVVSAHAHGDVEGGGGGHA